MAGTRLSGRAAPIDLIALDRARYLNGPTEKQEFVVLPASGWLMMANMRVRYFLSVGHGNVR
jgi:hypothetical protein